MASNTFPFPSDSTCFEESVRKAGALFDEILASCDPKHAPLDSHRSSQIDYALPALSTHTVDNTFWPGIVIPGLNYAPVFDEPIGHDPVASAVTTFDASDASYWDAVLSSSSFNASSFAESFDPALAPLPPVLAFPNSTPGTTFPPPATTTSAQGSKDTVVCQWAGCGAVVQQRSVYRHLTDTHGHEVPSKSKALLACRWTDCTAAFHELRPHVRLHYGVDVPCDACGETFSRRDATRRHQTNGACKKCPWCKARFDTIEDKVAHVAKCVQRDVGTKAGRERTVGKVGSVARPGAHPYKN